MTKLQTQTLARLDQVWAEVDEKMDQLASITTCGPRSNDDAALIQDTLLLVIAELYHRRSVRMAMLTELPE